MTQPEKDINTEMFVCYTFPKFLVVENKLQTASVLHIDRQTGKITQQQKQDVDFTEKNHVVRAFSCFLGVATLEQIKHLVFCDECLQTCYNSKIAIYEISSLFLVAYPREADIAASGKKTQLNKKTRQLNELLSKGFYFSYDYNVTQSFQYQKNPYLEEFAWNKTYLKELKSHVNGKEWAIPIIQGFVGTFTNYVEGHRIQYILISRRSWIKGGTRYFDRGINQEGFVANFVETEQIILVGNYVASHVQIRGSVPIYFQQIGLTTKVKINRSNELSRESFKRHVDYCKRRYGKVLIVDLLDTEKSGENIIMKQFQKHVTQSQQPDVKYYYFNFHQRCPNNTFHNVNKALQDLGQMNKNLGYYIQDTSNGNVLNRQMGVVRSNCLDCLDRTNVLESKVAADAFDNILFDVGLNMEELMTSKFVQQMDSNSSIFSLAKQFKRLWADNGDQISFHYTGTGSTHSDFTRQGKRNITGMFKHKVKSVTRFYNQNFWDFHKMKLVDLLLESKQSQLQNEKIPNILKQRQSEFCSYRELTLEILTWKVSNIKVPEVKTLFKGGDIVVVGIQQIEPSNNLFSYNTEDLSARWIDYLMECLNLDSEEKYLEVCRCYQNNNLCVGLIKASLKSSLSGIEACNVKFNYLDNKSCSLIRFQLDDNSLVFGSCQLEYGKEDATGRVRNMKDVYKNAFQEEGVGKKKSELIEFSDYKFVFGNLNMAVNLDNQILKIKVKQLVDAKAQGRFDPTKDLGNFRQLYNKNLQLFEYDELETLKQSSDVLRDFQQQSVTFLPTYKYQKGQCRLDTSKSPGWADRILYSSYKTVECLSYSTLQIYESDHLPLLAQFKITVQKEDGYKKERVYQQILKDLNLESSMDDQLE